MTAPQARRPLGSLDRIEVTGIRAWGRHGVLAAEKELGQQFVVDVTLHLSTAPAGRTDTLARTVNYAEVAAAVAEEIGGGPHDLVEALAESIAARILTDTGHPLVRRVGVRVHKPAAPVGLPVGDVVISLERDAAPVQAVLALGTNLGDREAHLARALELLAGTEGLEVEWTGPVLETAPVGGPEGQGAYLNSAIGVVTTLGPFDLLETAHRAERDARRERLVRWGPRTLDVDVITYGSYRSDDEELTLPHPRAHQRAFVLAPWHAARPQAELPGHGPVAALLEGAEDRDGLRPGPHLTGFEHS
ncbi:2-amino-4-hydroxy-6-hydroxymethyldihydropteridine diphosphokinase [Brachybacterium sacelli]|uniref:Bifunctional folate synthesis protein n=1 Tax=Brachybacterium sacelli TaxID=173364 RepID=A0ABS4X1V2_9MICO|nr:2-amino-4-hydroxy-6-hydroxymethyldihydropteridine diphosphokinase [Brachybacterium sacelli]MBP2382412.1 dihydroneopterin aldolase/2-amino-4-hydroxy-6-hydroxymethyldihydropteridine diphosphokinase [Brachybacterium sacelli]